MLCTGKHYYLTDESTFLMIDCSTMKSGNKEFRHYRSAFNCSLLYSKSDSMELKRYGIIQVLPFSTQSLLQTATFCRDKKMSLKEASGSQVVRPPAHSSANFKFRPACSGSSLAKF